MGVYRICRSFTVESGHMLSKHPERCRYPHGHTRRIEIVLTGTQLNDHDMIVDFKALKLALEETVEIFDHSMAVNSEDPMRKVLETMAPKGVVVFDHTDPTTEVIARDIFESVQEILKSGWSGKSKSGVRYEIPRNQLTVERVRVYETPHSWAEYGLSQL